jgi:hypothetical protein
MKIELDNLPQFNRKKNGSLYDRGKADAYYRRDFEPHWYPEGTYNGERIVNLAAEEINEYNKGYRYQESTGIFKEYE